MKKKEVKRVLRIAYETMEGRYGGVVDVPIVKAASIDTGSGMQFMYLERKVGRDGFTLNWTTSLIPEGMRIQSMNMERDDGELA